jgi:hypothetical protein
VEEYWQFHDMGIDGVFSDFSDMAVDTPLLYKILASTRFARCFTEGRDDKHHYFNHFDKQDCFDLN